MGKNNSFEKINYSIRPAKIIERKMILQFCSRLFPFDFVENYHYIGFGSIYYSDFTLFHKSLNIRKMSSIEFERNESRARFNLPFSCINLLAGHCNTELPKLINSTEKNITWLDYDSPLSSNALDDIQTYAGATSSGSMLLVTFNTNSDDNPCFSGNMDALFEYRKNKLKERILEKKIPTISKPIQLNKKNLHKLYREIIINEIEETLLKRNKKIIPNEEILYKQIINFDYSDDAKMMTLGFVFYQQSETQQFYQCKFEELKQYRGDSNSYIIKAPKLTVEEIRALNKILPKKEGIEYGIDEINNSAFDKAIEEYAEVYQYFPQFTEVLY